MEIDNVQDTPQNANPGNADSAFDPIQANEGSSSEFSVDDIILGKTEAADEALAIPAQEPEIQPQEVQQNDNPPAPEQPMDAKNDDTRYQYWQSRAARLENRLGQIEAQQMQSAQQMQAQQAAAQEPQREEFPLPPDKPKKPRTFSREEAYTDSASESAKYLDDMDEWRDTMDEYNQAKQHYEISTVREQMEKQEAIRVREIQKQQAYAQQMQQVQQVSQTVQQKYGLNESEAQSFIKDMSSADSLTMDNLVQLWRMQNGQAAPVQNAPVQNAPSPTFQQTKRAQQIPSPMGTMPSTGTQAQGSTEDQIMDKMVSDFNAKNPFK